MQNEKNWATISCSMIKRVVTILLAIVLIASLGGGLYWLYQEKIAGPESPKLPKVEFPDLAFWNNDKKITPTPTQTVTNGENVDSAWPALPGAGPADYVADQLRSQLSDRLGQPAMSLEINVGEVTATTATGTVSWNSEETDWEAVKEKGGWHITNF